MAVSFVGDYFPSGDGSSPLQGPSSPVVGNLECAFSDGEVMSGKAYANVVPVRQMDELRSSGFAALSLANNHVQDAGNFLKIAEVLKSRFPNIQFFGTRNHPFARLERNGRPVLIIGCLESCRSRGAALFRQEDVESLIVRLREVSASANAEAEIYVYPHWGKEGEYTRWPSPAQQRLARRWIDAGADGVFGGHSHVFQGYEVYKGRPIFYSLGNFHFPHPESALYEGTDTGLCVEVEGTSFTVTGTGPDQDKVRGILEDVSAPLKSWTTWKWALAVGAFNLRKNTASWKIRLRKNFFKTLPKFLVWQCLPKTLLFRVASLFSRRGR